MRISFIVVVFYYYMGKFVRDKVLEVQNRYFNANTAHCDGTSLSHVDIPVPINMCTTASSCLLC